MATILNLRSYIVITFCCVCLSATAESNNPGFDPQRLERLDKVLSAYVENGEYPGFTGLIIRNNQVAHKVKMGWQDKERKIAMRDDTIFRIYSMSKAITSTAAMILFEEGHFQIDDPIHTFLPELKDLRVYVSGEGNAIKTEPLQRPVTFRDLFTHTAGFTYHFMGDGPVEQLYRKNGLKPGTGKLYYREGDATPLPNLKNMVTTLANVPLLHQPGERMSYSISIDVLGRLIEVISGQSLDKFFKERLFHPLGMVDTGFVVPKNKLYRFAANYTLEEQQLVLFDDLKSSRYLESNRLLSGGGGLVSTTQDYMRFLQMILNGGKLDDSRILSPKTIDFMLSNHFPKANMLRPAWMAQQGHGLGFALALDPAAMGLLTSENTADWAGAASTFFWVDRKEQIAAVFMTQRTPLEGGPLLDRVRTLTYQALVD